MILIKHDNMTPRCYSYFDTERQPFTMLVGCTVIGCFTTKEEAEQWWRVNAKNYIQ